MKKSILFIIVALLYINLSIAQSICNISPKVKEAGDAMTKENKHPLDELIIGDYREEGSGWVLLSDHTGATFFQNTQINELIWVLHSEESDVALAVMIFKNELDKSGKLQLESQNFFMVEMKSDFITLENTVTNQIYILRRTNLIPSNENSHKKNVVDKNSNANKSFSSFANVYINDKILAWGKKGEFEITSDWKVRVNEETRNNKMKELSEEAIDAYADWLNIKLGFCYMGASLSLGSYNADKEVYIIKSRDFGELEIPVPIEEAEKFKYKHWCSHDSDPTNVIYFIINDELGLAQATFWDKYRYINQISRKKTKKEIAYDYFLQAIIYYKNKEFKKAAAYYQKVIDLKPDIMKAENFEDLGNANFFIEDYSKSIINYKKALDIDYLQEVKDENIYFNMGVSYYNLKQYLNAINAFNNSIRLSYGRSKNSKVRSNLMGQAYYELKDYSNAINYYGEYSNFVEGEDKAQVYNIIGVAYNNIGNYKLAIWYSNLAIQISPDLARPYFNLGNAYKGLDNKRQTIKAYKEAARLGDKEAQSTLMEQRIKW